MTLSPTDLVDQIAAIHAAATASLRDALRAYLDDGTVPDRHTRTNGDWAYPELRLHFAGGGAPRPVRAFARLTRPGHYATTVTRPELYRDYLVEQLTLIMADYEVSVEVGRSAVEIPYPFVLDGAADLRLDAAAASELARHFPTTELAQIGDELADGLWDGSRSDVQPLALFDAPRTDFSLARLKHYTGTAPEDFQHYILLTNYHRYVDEFVRWACARLGTEGYGDLLCPGGLSVTAADPSPAHATDDVAWRKQQMPAWHLTAPGRAGISLVNIGVGPANAKTITDHIAVLRPHAWIMLGHCAGLRNTQQLGDYVLAHGYVREDHVLDEELPLWVPIPALAEIQVALEAAVSEVTQLKGPELKRIMRTGTVASTDNRNWELLPDNGPQRRFSQSRAVALDMESATIAANGFRFRVPYGTLLCVSDKPLHGEIKLPGMANHFYRERVDQHLRIGIRAVELLREQGVDQLHSRKLRSFAEVAFQ